jgi:hypothetical protein
MTDRLLCDNEDHGPRPAYAAVTWPDGRFRGSRAAGHADPASAS